MVLVLPTTPFKDLYIVMISYHISMEDFRLSTTLVPIEISSLAFFYFMAYRRFPQRLNFQRTIFRYTFVLFLVQLNTVIAYQKCMSSILAPISLKMLQFCFNSVIIVCERSNSYDNKGWRTNKKRS